MMDRTTTPVADNTIYPADRAAVGLTRPLKERRHMSRIYETRATDAYGSADSKPAYRRPGAVESKERQRMDWLLPDLDFFAGVGMVGAALAPD
jgi:hypothetical protein